MDHDDDLAAFGLAEVDEDRAHGEWADPHAPEVGEALTVAQAVAAAMWWLVGDGSSAPIADDVWAEVTALGGLSFALARTILAWAPVVEAAGAQTEAAARFGDNNERRRAADATEAAVRAMRAATGGDA